ncbi:MAG: DUF932 domain-containing protein [Albidovulum sp.]|nr:DUF932 domain-containing protein [Albidovulum sp.]MDE0534611.1 DUF932 domain-containing protein [Albidovulum sp.]
MPRLNLPDQVFFPVELRDLYFVETDQAGRRNRSRQPPTAPERYRRVGNRKVIVNVLDDTVVGVVGSNYRLLTNKEAVDAAHKCCSLVFPETHSSEWQINSVDAPGTRSYCHIDLVHNTAKLEFEFVMTGARRDVPEAFGPFIRVTNSYNGSRALAFSIGFYRKVCANGMVSPEDIVKFRFEHTSKDMKRGIKFKVAEERLARVKQSFLDSFQALHDCPVERVHFVPLIRSVLAIANPEAPTATAARPLSAKDKQEWKVLKECLDTISEKYAEEQGENAYAVLNAVTELASHPPQNRYLRRDKHTLQKLAGEWTIAFKAQCRRPSFDISKYLSELTDTKQAAAVHPRARP